MRPWWWGRPIALGLAVGTIIAVGCVVPDAGHSLAEERRLLAAMAIEKTASAEQFEGVIRQSLLRYPAEPFIPLMGAVRAQTFGEGNVVAWTGRALERNPRFGRAHLVLARSLTPAHAAQARLEYRLAYEYDVGLRSAVVTEGRRVIVDAASALELVPDGEPGDAMLDALVPALSERLPSTAVMLDEELDRRAPGGLTPVRRRAQAAAADVTDGAPWCADARSACATEAMARAEELIRRDPSKCDAHILLARVRIARHEVGLALDDLERAMETVSDPPTCQREIIQLAFQAGDGARGDAALEQLVRRGCGTAIQCLDIYGWAGSVEESRGHWVRAVRLYRRVLEIQPEREDMLQRIGALGDHAGLLADGLDAYATLASRHPSDPQWPARSAELRGHYKPAARTLPTVDAAAP